MRSMKLLLIPVILAVPLLLCSTDPDYGITDLVKYRLKGSVKSLMETKYTVGEGADSTVVGKEIYQKLFLFNEDGYESAYTLYQNGNPYLIASYTFNPEGPQAELKEYRSDGSLNMTAVYQYDKKGFRVHANYYWGDEREIGDFSENTDYYNEILNNDIYTKAVFKNEYRGFCLEENYLRPDSSLSFKFVNRYDFQGNKLESGYFHGSGRLSWMTKMKYDRYNNMIESSIYKSNHIAVYSKYTYVFDDIGNWTYRKESRKVHENILTAGLEKSDIITERVIEYY